MSTTMPFIYKVRSKAKRAGHVLPAASRSSSSVTDAFAARATPKRGKGSRSRRALYERSLVAIAKHQKDLEYGAARDPRKVADYAINVFSRIELYSGLWRQFKVMAGSSGLRQCIDEAVSLIPSFREQTSTELANGRPPPNVADYVASAINCWVESFKIEKRGKDNPPGEASAFCGCGTKYEVFAKPPLGPNTERIVLCSRCRRRLSWNCNLCGSEMKVLEERGIPYLECLVCRYRLNFATPIPYHFPITSDLERLWDLLWRNVGLDNIFKAWEVVDLYSRNLQYLKDPDTLQNNIAYVISQDAADRLVSQFFGIEYHNPLERARRQSDEASDSVERALDRAIRVRLALTLLGS